MTRLSAECVLLDVEGTLIEAGAPIPGAAGAVAALRRAGVRVVCMTNVDSATPGEIAARLVSAGIEFTRDDIVTPAVALAEELSVQENPSCLLLLPATIAATLERFRGAPGSEVDYVVVGDTRSLLDYELLNRAFRAVEAGAELLALQRSPWFLDVDGRSLDTGAIVAALEAATGRSARVLGKPAPGAFAAALAVSGVAASAAVMVGDDVENDVYGAVAAGLDAILVRTGKFSAGDLARLPDGAQVCDSIADIPGLLGIAGE